MNDLLHTLTAGFNPYGLRLVAIVLFGGLVAVVALDFVLELRDQPPVGHLVTRWARRYPYYPAAIALVFGMFIAHIFWSTPG